MEGNLRGLRESYAIGHITLEELERGLDSVLAGGPINVPQASERTGLRWDRDNSEWVAG